MLSPGKTLPDGSMLAPATARGLVASAFHVAQNAVRAAAVLDPGGVVAALDRARSARTCPSEVSYVGPLMQPPLRRDPAPPPAAWSIRRGAHRRSAHVKGGRNQPAGVPAPASIRQAMFCPG